MTFDQQGIVCSYGAMAFRKQYGFQLWLFACHCGATMLQASKPIFTPKTFFWVKL